jgi:CDP-diacylglycerol---glycerol-3-phosphate 3-phosphatidyltransferase
MFEQLALKLVHYMSRVSSEDAEKGGWDSFDRTQKAGAVAAGALTLARPVLAGVAAVGIATSEAASWKDAALIAAAFATDADGTVARRFKAETDFGRIADPIADKVSMGMIEATLAKRRGGLALALFAVRVARDIAVNATRRKALRAGCSPDDIKANGYGKASTCARMGVAFLGSTPPGSRHNKLINAADAAGTTLTVVSGAITIAKIWRSRRAAKA